MRINTKITIMLGLTLAGVICLGAAMKAEQQVGAAKKQWNQQNARAAFDKALTRSAYDKSFRDRLTVSPQSAREAVAEEGQIVVPAEVVIMFHEDRSNENYHIFDLPKFDGNTAAPHEYKEHFQCCYQPW